MHSVTPVLSAREPRLSFVNSFGRRDVFAEDRTRYDGRGPADPEEVYTLEFTRHRVWRVMGQMKHIVESVPFGTDVETMADLLGRASEELAQAKRLLLREERDFVGYFKQTQGVAAESEELEVGEDRHSRKARL